MSLKKTWTNHWSRTNLLSPSRRNASGWCRRLREPISPLSLLNCDQPWQLFSRVWTILLSTVIYDLDSRITTKYSKCHTSFYSMQVHPKTLFEIFLWTAVLFRRIWTFPQIFRFGFIPGNSGIQQIVRHSMLMGRWREGRILTHLCGKNNVRNCDLLQRDFFARYRTVLGRAKDFFGVYGDTWKTMRTRNVVTFYAWETCY